MLNFRTFCLFKELLSATYAFTSRKYIAEQGMTVPKLSETFKVFWLHSSVFALKNSLKIFKFSGFFPSNRTLREVNAPTPRKYVVK